MLTLLIKHQSKIITMNFSVVILQLLLQIVAYSVALPDCICVEAFNLVEECA